jgi:hypothetical protein
MDHRRLYKENGDWGTSIQPMKKNPTAYGTNIQVPPGKLAANSNKCYFSQYVSP